MRMQLTCLLLLFSAALAMDIDIPGRYEKFKKQHIINRMNVGQCDHLMRRINTGKCKKTNTFILAKANQVKSVCTLAGKPYFGQTRSLKPFPIIVCSSTTANFPICQYHGKALTRRIIIKCEKGVPVHYGGDIKHCEN